MTSRAAEMCNTLECPRITYGHRFKRTCGAGPELRRTTTAGRAASPHSRQRRQLADVSVAAQCEKIATAATSCAVVVATTALRIAARSGVEKLGIR